MNHERLHLFKLWHTQTHTLKVSPQNVKALFHKAKPYIEWLCLLFRPSSRDKMSQDLRWHITNNFKMSLGPQCHFSVTKYLHHADGVVWRNVLRSNAFRAAKRSVIVWELQELTCKEVLCVSERFSTDRFSHMLRSSKNPCSTFVILTTRSMKSPYRACLCAWCCSSCFLPISWAYCSFSLSISASFSSPSSLSLSAFPTTWLMCSFYTDGDRGI